MAWLLGAGGWMPTDERETTSILIRRGSDALLIDAGTGVRRLVTDQTLLDGVRALDVVLTHFHLDHTCGLLYLPAIFAAGELDRSPKLVAPGRWLFDASTSDVVAPLIDPPLSPFPGSFFDEILELRGGSQQIGPFTLNTIAQRRHWGPTAGLRIDDALAILTDTAYEADHAAFVSGASHLLHEAWSSSANPILPDHDATGADAARTAAEGCVANLTLIHLNPLLGDPEDVLADARRGFPTARLGIDGSELAVDG